MEKILKGYQEFRKKYAHGDKSVMKYLSYHGQNPETMVVACCDSRVDPAVILQCDPGDLFVIRNVANIVPPFEKDEMHHGTSAALEFGVCILKVRNLILLGHSQCGGIQALLGNVDPNHRDFITRWVSLIDLDCCHHEDTNHIAKMALNQSYRNCLTFPWIKKRVDESLLRVHLWFFDIEAGEIFTYSNDKKAYIPLSMDE